MGQNNDHPRLYKLYLKFHEHFCSETLIRYPKLTFEQFEAWLSALDEYPRVKQNMINNWKKGSESVVIETDRKVEMSYDKYRQRIITVEQMYDEVEELYAQVWGPEKAMEKALSVS